MIYTIILGFHNIFRWFCLAIIAYVVVKSFFGWINNREWSNKEEKSLLLATIFVDIQLLVGFILYFFYSPLTKFSLEHFKSVMSDPTLRFFILEHSITMVFAVILIHIAKIVSKKKKIVYTRFRTIFFYYALALIAILIGIPWFRPLFPGLH